MAIIYSYPQATVKPSDRILASDTTQTGNPTINITVGGIANYILTLLGFGSGTPGYMPVWVTDQQLGNSYVYQITGPNTSIHTEKATFEKNVGVLGDAGIEGNLVVGGAVPTTAQFLADVTTEVRGDANFYKRVNVGTVGTTNVSPIQIYNTTQFYGDIRDTGGNIGTNTQVLSSLGAGSGVEWVDQLPSGLNFKGTWDAFNNIPVLASGVGVQGDYYIVSADGTTNLDGFNSWEIGDWCVFNGTVWQEIDNQNIFSGTGTANTMTKWTGTTSLGDSQTTDDGTNIVMNTPGGGITLVSSSDLSIDSATVLHLNQSNPTISIKNWGPTVFEESAYFKQEILDSTTASGAAGQVLSSTGAGAVQWIDVSAGAGAISGSGTVDTVVRWTPSGVELGDSSIRDDLNALLLTPTVKTTVDSPTIELLPTVAATIGTAGVTTTFDGVNDFQGDAKFAAKIIDNFGSSGTSGQVLASTIAATQWVSPLLNTSGARQISVSVDFNELGNLATTPKQLIASPGVGKVIEVLSVAFKYTFNTTVYDFTSYLVVCADGFVGNTDAIQSGFKETLINGASDVLIGNQNGVNLGFGGQSIVENTAIVLGTPGIDPTQGDGDLRLNIIYRILNVSNMTVDIT
tara:strand:+ start:1426 stop:3312 length:1887 start_codon:yes stop_codon:yes gene_type:complete